MALLDTVKTLLGSAWHVNSDAALAALLPAADGTVEGGKPVVPNSSKVIDTLDVTLLKIGGVDKSKAAIGVAAGYKIARGQATTASASDTIVTGLTTVVAAVANLEDAPVIGCDRAQAVIGDQAGTPAAGSILLKTYKPTASGDATPVAATTTGKKVNWIAIGT
jgi:hypothetical protein